MQTSYTESSGCACGPSSTTIVVPNETVQTPSFEPTAPSTGRPEIPSEEPTPTERTLQRPANGADQAIQDAPTEAEPNGSGYDSAPEATNTDNATYLEPPKLFDPKDRTAQRKIAPVRTALYEQPVGYQRISARHTRITAEQAKRDAAGWTSASH
jgi:hypothetical protein